MQREQRTAHLTCPPPRFGPVHNRSRSCTCNIKFRMIMPLHTGTTSDSGAESRAGAPPQPPHVRASTRHTQLTTTIRATPRRHRCRASASPRSLWCWQPGLLRWWSGSAAARKAHRRHHDAPLVTSMMNRLEFAHYASSCKHLRMPGSLCSRKPGPSPAHRRSTILPNRPPAACAFPCYRTRSARQKSSGRRRAESRPCARVLMTKEGSVLLEVGT